MASENDGVPEFSAKTIPAGTAPADRTFKPNNISEVPPMKDYSDDADPESERASAQDTIPGATSADVHTGLGHPGQGMTSNELRHDGMKGGKHQSVGLEGVASGAKGSKLVDSHDPQFQDQRALNKEEADVGRGTRGGAAAEEMVPEGADTVASEAPKGR